MKIPKISLRNLKSKSFKAFKIIISIAGVCSFLFVGLAFTDLPYHAYHSLAMTELQGDSKPDYIVIMGGDGMPSPSGLIRCYYAAIEANKSTNSQIIIALPYNEKNELYQLDLMSKELRLKGIDSSRIIYEPRGYNTHSQVQNIQKIILDKKSEVLIVTSPEHMFRTIKTFEKLGYSKLSSLPTFEIPSDSKQLEDRSNPKEKKVRNLSLRYNLWSYMQYEIKVMREYTAIAYYKCKSWI